jgi:mRNA-degrading endonuclease RelE of RelBE toxin-antitoxin system
LMKCALSFMAKKQLQRLPKTEQRKIERRMSVLESNAFEGKKLCGELAGLRTLRSWPYRIIYYIENDTVIIDSIAHRQGVYK